MLFAGLPSFVTLVPGVRDSDDLCNATKDGPWFFRTAVPDGSVLILKIANEHVQLFVPSDVKCAVHLLDPRRTRVSRSKETFLDFFRDQRNNKYGSSGCVPHQLQDSERLGTKLNDASLVDV